MIVPREAIPELYASGKHMGEIAELTGVARCTVRRDLIAAGVTLRTRKEAMALLPDIGSKLKGRKRVITEEWRQNNSKAQLAHREGKAKRFRVNTNGYLAHTCGENEGRNAHVTIMEKRIGRRLLSDETVHHIDGNKLNNNENNLALLTLSGHARLHRREEEISGRRRARNQSGQFAAGWNGESK